MPFGNLSNADNSNMPSVIRGHASYFTSRGHKFNAVGNNEGNDAGEINHHILTASCLKS